VNTIHDFVSVNAIRINEENFKTSTLYVLIKLFFINKKKQPAAHIFFFTSKTTIAFLQKNFWFFLSSYAAGF